MFQRKPRRFSRRHSNGRNYHSHEKDSDKLGLRGNSFSKLHPRNNFQSQKSAEKLVEKYNGLAKEALTSGDRVLSESYFQYADHYMRIVEEKALNQNKVINVNKETLLNNKESSNTVANNSQDSQNQSNQEKNKFFKINIIFERLTQKLIHQFLFYRFQNFVFLPLLKFCLKEVLMFASLRFYHLVLLHNVNVAQ